MKGQGIYAFVTLVDGVPYSEELRKSLILAVRKQVCLFSILPLSKFCETGFHALISLIFSRDLSCDRFFFKYELHLQYEHI